MAFKTPKQRRAAFSGDLGANVEAEAKQWAKEKPRAPGSGAMRYQLSLPRKATMPTLPKLPKPKRGL